MSERQRTNERTILKQSGLSRVVPIAVWIFCALGCIDGIVEGTAGFAVRTILVLGAVALATWIVLFSPYLGVDAEGVTIINPTRVITVPFGALVDVRVGGAASIIARVAGGRERKITSWNAPGVQRRRPPRRVGGMGGPGAAGLISNPNRSNPQDLAATLSTPKPSTSQVEAAVDRFRSVWERDHTDGDSTATATMTWRWREWAVLLVLIAINVAIRLR